MFVFYVLALLSFVSCEKQSRDPLEEERAERVMRAREGKNPKPPVMLTAEQAVEADNEGRYLLMKDINVELVLMQTQGRPASSR